jgi:fatty acid desaturase
MFLNSVLVLNFLSLLLFYFINFPFCLVHVVLLVLLRARPKTRWYALKPTVYFKVDYVESQFRSTRDFVCSNPALEYLAGGMNYQLEHHLFPTMPRYMYPKLVPVVKQFAAENNLPYKV